MHEINPLRDLRFEGMDIPRLLEWIGKIKEGEGPGSMHGAVDALQQAVRIVVDLDETLRIELGKLQIAWEGNAGSIAQEAARQQIATMRGSQDPLQVSADSVQAQGEGYSSAKHSLPDRQEMRHHESENVAEWAGSAFGYESDYDQEAKQVAGQKQAAQAALGAYRDTTVAQAEQFRPMPELRPASVSAQSAAPGSVPNAGSGPVGFATAGSGDLAASGPGAVFVGGGLPRRSPDGSPGGGDGEPRRDGADGGAGIEDGDRSGSGAPETGGAPGRTSRGGAAPGGMSTGTMVGLGGGGAAIAGLGAVAAGKLLGGSAGTPEGGVRGGGAAGSDGRSASGAPRSSGIGGGPGDVIAGRTAGGSPTSKPAAGALMGPAATRGESKPDEEHENDYAAEETLFDDNRLAAPPVFGSTPEADAEAAVTDADAAAADGGVAAEKPVRNEEKLD